MYWKTLLEQRTAAGKVPVAVFTDIDNTFYRPDRASDSRRLTELLASECIPLVAVTGPAFNAVYQRIVSGELPHFAAIASAVGTEIHHLWDDGGQLFYQADQAWREGLLARGFKRDLVVQAAEGLLTRVNRDHPEWNVTFQGGDPEDFKVSFHYHARSSGEASLIAAVLSGEFPNFCTLWCEDINWTPRGNLRRYCFDVLPVTKVHPVNHLFSEMGLKGGLVAGDSGNDATMILDSCSQLTGVVVGGAREELLTAVAAASGRKTGKSVITFNDGTLGPESLMAAVTLQLLS